MRFSNKNRTPVYNFINTSLLLFFMVGVLGFLLVKFKFYILGLESYLFVIIPTFFILFFYLNGRQIFEYDSDGEALHFKNRNVVPFLNRPLHDEFPKYKLLNYDIINIFFVKRLYITISSKNNGSTILKYQISYLKRKEVNNLKLSLSRVIKANNEKKEFKKIDDDRRVLS